MYNGYIFNVSYQRNATTSFHHFMEILGLESLHNSQKIFNYLGIDNCIMYLHECDDLDYYKNHGNGSFIEKFIQDNKNKLFDFIKKNKYQVYSDNPWPIMYKDLHNYFNGNGNGNNDNTDNGVDTGPNEGAKFILFVRDPDQWLNSMTNYFKNEVTIFRKILYDGHINDAYCKERYIEHNKNVIDFFTKNDINKLLVINLDTDTDIDIAIAIKKFLTNKDNNNGDNDDDNYKDNDGRPIRFPSLNSYHYYRKF